MAFYAIEMYGVKRHKRRAEEWGEGLGMLTYHENPARCRAGRWRQSTAAVPAVSGPGEGKALPVLVAEEVGVDRCCKARVIHCDR